ncbi:MAG: hypothetical protein EU550_00335 [Promethearchaeota archaeon]|nr:MAG: hypothetical protein EU550_00335 [Candidatus Lokiarchaeota archaeon]
MKIPLQEIPNALNKCPIKMKKVKFDTNVSEILSRRLKSGLRLIIRKIGKDGINKIVKIVEVKAMTKKNPLTTPLFKLLMRFP